MKDRFCSLIILGPGAPRAFKLHLSRGAIAILILAFVLAFLAAVAVGYTYPQAINDNKRAELEAENRALRLEASNAAIGIQRLNLKLETLEATSKRIDQLAKSQ